MNNYHRQKCAARLAVEAILKLATIENPITVDELVNISGLKSKIVRTHLSSCVHMGIAHNFNIRKGAFVYAWGPMPAKQKSSCNEPRSCFSNGIYDGAELTTISTRPGAMDAYMLPSREGGITVEHHRPLILPDNMVYVENASSEDVLS